MAKKTALLKYLIENAENLAKTNGATKVTANYFMASVLYLVDEKANGRLPDALKDDSEAVGELDVIEKEIQKYDIKSNVAAMGIVLLTKGSDCDAMEDELIYHRARNSAVRNALEKDKEFIDTMDYLSFLLESPTAEIKRYVIEAKTATGGDTFGKIDTDFEVPPRRRRRTRASSEEESEPKKKLTVKEELELSITKARALQRSLLENVYGQDHAVNAVVGGYFRSMLMEKAMAKDGKPKALFLFAGPPGVGKTYLAECIADSLKLPFRRFDMSEYADKEANLEFCGSDSVYKGGKPGNVTSFVAENPECVLLFDEVEKAHINVIHLFLQMLDAGRLRDNHSDTEVSFEKALIIFTTNAGKNLYEQMVGSNLGALPKKQILKALSKDLNPVTKEPLFPAAICSRFASGNVVMFNHLEANNLYVIAKKELEKNAKGLEKSAEVSITIDDKVPTALMLAEGGNADARTVKGRAISFFYNELYELFRLISSKPGAIEGLKSVNVSVKLDKEDEEMSSMFIDTADPTVLVFANGDTLEKCKEKLNNITYYHADTIADAKEILFNHDVSIILCDVFCNENTEEKPLNLEDIVSDGHEFLEYVLSGYDLPVYLLERKEGEVSEEERLSFASMGVRGLVPVYEKANAFENTVLEKCNIAYQQSKINKLVRENKVLAYKTAQIISPDGSHAEIRLFDFSLVLVTDVDDSKGILDNVHRPNLTFNDVIGATDAKRELTYFVNYMKDPIKYLRKGVHAPKGVLLYGPPGTGKTMLAKAMAGESNVTFIATEGNEFLKRYVGEGAEAVHKLFISARKYAPSVIFIDEIDAIGKNREGDGAEHTGNVLTALLTELDGFNTDTSRPVFVLAATNFDVEQDSKRSLDPALLRRFDRRIYIGLPDKDERKQFIHYKLNKNGMITLSEAQIENIAIRSTGMSLAQLDSVFEMAMRNAIRDDNCEVGDEAFEEAFETFNSGEKKTWSESDLKRTARHEAGHALVYWLSGRTPSFLTIVARSDHGGYMQHGDSEGKGVYTRNELLSLVRTSLAGRACEIVYYGEEEGISTGASGDLYSATRNVENMICRYGMDSTLGMSSISGADVTTEYYSRVRDRVNQVLKEELETTIELISQNKEAIDAIVEVLLEKNQLKGDEIDEIFSRYITRK